MLWTFFLYIFSLKHLLVALSRADFTFSFNIALYVLMYGCFSDFFNDWTIESLAIKAEKDKKNHLVASIVLR